MEKMFFRCLFIMSIMFLYVVFGIDVPIIVLLSFIYFKLGDIDEGWQLILQNIMLKFIENKKKQNHGRLLGLMGKTLLFSW